MNSSSLARFAGWIAAMAIGASVPVAPASAQGPAAAPFRLNPAIGAPGWLTVGGSYRLRYETLDGRFRHGETGSDQILVERLLLQARAQWGHVYAGGELEDSRAQLADAGTHLGTDSVDAFEPLQAYAGVQAQDIFAAGDRLDVEGGRFTMDLGSRRLIARNRFRNTLNAFTGLQARWHGAGGTDVTAFFVLPIDRMPTANAALLDNAVRLDSESWHTRLWGVFVSRPALIGRATGEAYLFGLTDEDRPGHAAIARELYTPGIRIVANPADDAWDYEIEAAMQFGTVQASKTSTRKLDRLAGLLHASVGYRWDAMWKPRLSLEYDYASGDEHPGDGTDNRFDTLYGARRFDFGPTGIYGAFARSNLETPGVRLEIAPSKRLDAMVGYRLFWLASARDAWTTAGLQDASGRAGDFLGEQIEARLRYEVLPGNLELEFGGALMTHGTFQREVSGAPAAANSTYGYAAATVSF